MSYGKIDIFISYSHEDIELMEYLKNKINSKPKLNAIVVPEIKDNLAYNSDKIIKAFKDSKIYLPILTSNSITNQWVNQEIGYAFSHYREVKNIMPIVEKEISSQLKGFITKNNDLNYRFSTGKSFESVADELVEDLFNRFKNYAQYAIY
jgi:hypothetical protein